VTYIVNHLTAALRTGIEEGLQLDDESPRSDGGRYALSQGRAEEQVLARVSGVGVT
jgi:hypothetical protein